MIGEYPHIRRIGCYLFFFACAFGVSLEAGLICKAIDVADWIVRDVSSIAGIVAFLALRDMTASQIGEQP